MKIAMIASEVVPFAKSGGLADVASSLSLALKKQGHDVRIIMPRYKSMSGGSTNNALSTTLYLRVGVATPVVKVVEEALEDVVPVYTLETPVFTEREGLYGDDQGAYSDNAYRYSLLSRGAIALCKELDWQPDVLHIHDWQCGPVAAYMQDPKIAEEVGGAKVVLTIHNLGYQGVFPKEDNLLVGMSPEVLRLCHGDLNFLKIAITYADTITTVSPTYAKEICTPEQGFGLDQLLASRKKNLIGILNGIDYTIWNSSKDPYLPYTFSPQNMQGKLQLKQEICNSYGLNPDPEIPLFAMITRLADQKGFKELLSEGVLERALEKNVQFLILGTGAKEYEDRLRNLGDRYNNLAALIAFDTGLSHRIEGAADFFLMPSRYEPCGLNQLFSLRYGAIPLVHRVGGLADTVMDLVEEEKATGILMDKLTPEELLRAMDRAEELWKNQELYRAVQSRGMKKRFDWKLSTKKYEKVYHNL